MSLYWPLAAIQNNDANFYVNITLNGTALDLTSYTPKVVLKATQQSADVSGTTFTIGSGLTWVAQKLGKLKLTIPHASLATAGTLWWRLDLVDGNGAIFTALYGPVTVKAA